MEISLTSAHAHLLGRGGEGNVYRKDDSPYALKVYHQPPKADSIKKLETMIGLAKPEFFAVSAWPRGIVRRNGLVIGFAMDLVAGHSPVHTLFGVTSRLATYPDTNWAFLIRLSSNIARALSTLHNLSVVVGDINHSSILVAPDATVKFVDTDSFQIRQNERVYTCNVGVGEYIAPERQGLSLDGLERSTEDDDFGLAVIIFQLLFLGRHPFAGVFHGVGEQTLEDSIKEFRFAYGRRSKENLMSPPPGALRLTSVGPLSDLFERAFSRAPRPTAIEWARACDILFSELTTCSVNRGHLYWNRDNACPWCEIERTIGVPVFYAGPTAEVAFRDPHARIAELLALKPPNHAPTTTGGSPSNLPVPKPRRALPVLRSLHFALCLLLFALTASFRHSIYSNVILESVIAGGSLWALALYLIHQREIKPILREWKSARASTDLIHAQLKAVSTAEFERLRKNAVEKLQAYQRVDAEKAAEILAYQGSVRERQLTRFLQRHTIEDAQIPMIGPGRKSTLRSFGIDTAADITQAAISRVPGFGYDLTARLMVWKHEVESRFTYDSAAGLSQQDRLAIESRFNTRRAQLAQEATLLISRTYHSLDQIKGQIDLLQRNLQTAQTCFDDVDSLRQSLPRLMPWLAIAAPVVGAALP